MIELGASLLSWWLTAWLHNITTQVNLADFWPTRLGVGLTALGAASNGVNLGTSGNTTGQMIGRLYAVTDSNGDPDIEARFGYVPDMAVIFGGVNDPGGTGTVQASPTPTDTTFTLDSGKGDKFKAGCWINVNDATGNAGAAARRVLSVVGDAITLETELASAPAAGATQIVRPLASQASSAVTSGWRRVQART